MPPDAKVRSVQPHPPMGIPKYFYASAFDGAQIAAPGKEKSRRLRLYERLSETHFAELPAELSLEDLRSLDAQLLARLDLEREERRMHFGSLALSSVLFFLVLPHLASAREPSLALGLLALLLLGLVAPYVLVYFGYENRVRAMGLAHLRLLEAIAAREEEPHRVEPEQQAAG